MLSVQILYTLHPYVRLFTCCKKITPTVHVHKPCSYEYIEYITKAKMYIKNIYKN